jgi:UDP-glucose 4-epimerase
MARVVVTGGAGFIGSHVADAYLNQGHEVLVIDSLVHGRRENVPDGAEFAELDIRDEECARLIREWKPDIINHHAAQMDVRVSVSDPRFDASVNVDGLLNVLEAGRAAGVQRIVYVSSGGVVYGEPEIRPTPEHMPKLPESPYGVTKLAGEQYLYYYHRVHGLEYVALRYSNVYGPRQDPHGEAGVVAIFSTRLLNESPLTIFGDGEQTRDYVYVGDVVAANLLLSGQELPPARSLDDRGFNVGTGIETSVTGLAEALIEASGRSVPIEYVEARPGELRHSSLDATRLRALGWSARTELGAGLANTFEWIAGASVAR